MLPEILTLKGFLSYREKQTLDFTKFHVALITGENGNGKSSILDAITFALFSIARGVLGNKKGLGDLVSNGEANLTVSLQFVQDGSRFKVIRTYDRAKGVSNVFLQREENGNFVNISENTIRETDKKIEDIVHMNYETFIASSFVMQGRSDYFTAKNPTERIEILSDMLNLGVYEEARGKVKEKLRQAEFEEHELSKTVLENKEEVKKISEVEKELKDKETKIEEMRLVIDKFNEEIETLRRSISEKDKLKSERKHTEEEIKKLEGNFKQKLKLEETFKEALDRINGMLSREKEIKDAYNELASVKKSYEEMLERSVRFQQLVGEKDKIISSIERAISIKKEKINSLKKSLSETQEALEDVTLKIKKEEFLEKASLHGTAKLEEEKSQFLKRLEEATTKREEITKNGKERDRLEARLKEIQRIKEERTNNINERCQNIEDSLKLINKKIEDSQYKELEPILIGTEQVYEKLKIMYEQYEAKSRQLSDKKNILTLDIRNLEQAIGELNEKLDLISLESEDKCPLCGSPLSLEHKEEIKKNYIAELQKNKEEQSVKREVLKKVEDEISTLKVVKSNEVEAAFRKAEVMRAEILKRKSVTDELNSQKEKLEDELANLNRTIKKGVLSKVENEELNIINVNLQQLGDVDNKLNEINDEVNNLGKRIEEVIKNINEMNLKASVHKANTISLNKNLSDFQENIQSLKKEISCTETLLASSDFMKEEYERVHSLEKAISDVNFDSNMLEQFKARKNEISKYENEFIELNGASVKKEETINNLTRLNQEKVDLEGLIVESRKHLLDIERQLEKFEGIDARLDKIKEKLQASSENYESVVREKTRLEEQHKRLIELKKSIFTGEEKITEYEQEKGILNVLDGMFGKEGIPVAVIRSVLPQIEMFSNDLLLQMTNGNMQVKFSTVKSGNSGNKNTFDIDVYDMGERRRYELFSGGEQFRINLAIRIGISLFLSSLSGAALEMLVIDEGLGSQDEAGKERIIKEISSIKDRFKKVIVITHVNDVKESFEYEIRVEKDSHTSRLFVI